MPFDPKLCNLITFVCLMPSKFAIIYHVCIWFVDEPPDANSSGRHPARWDYGASAYVMSFFFQFVDDFAPLFSFAV